MKQRAIIVDIDGTISDSRHRQHFVQGEKKDWKAFFRHIDKDPVKRNVERVLKSYYDDGVKLIFITGRDEDFRTRTNMWFEANCPWLVEYLLWMRPMGDFRQDALIKREIYERVVAPTYDVELVLEDRSRVVEMWRSIGLECWQVETGNF